MPDLIKELSFYRKYHHNNINVLIHVVCIPLIFLSSLYNLTAWRIPREILPISTPNTHLNLGWVLGIGYSIFYIMLDIPFGVPYSALLCAALYFMSENEPIYGKSGHRIAWLIWTFGWIAQFIGHGKFEKRAPALLDNLVQALVLAPFFAAFEVAYYLGIRKDVIERVDEKVLPEIKEFHKKRKAA